MASDLMPLRAVAFEVGTYPKQPAFAVDKEVRTALGIEGSGGGERLHLLPYCLLLAPQQKRDHARWSLRWSSG